MPCDGSIENRNRGPRLTIFSDKWHTLNKDLLLSREKQPQQKQVKINIVAWDWLLIKYFNFTTLELSFIVLETRKSCASWVFDYTHLPWSLFTFFYLQHQKTGCSLTLQSSQTQTLGIDVTIQREGCAFYRFLFSLRGLDLHSDHATQCSNVKLEPYRPTSSPILTMSSSQYASHHGQAGFSWRLILQWQSNRCINIQLLS